MTQQAGWYPDPQQPKQQRYWDGAAWGPPAPAPPPPPRRKISPLWIIAGVLLLCPGSCIYTAIQSSDHKPSSSTSSSSSSSSHSVSSKPEPPTYTTAEYQDAAIDTCQKAVKKGLKDPDSAKFGDDWKAWKITASNSTPPSGLIYNPAAGDQYFNASGSVNAKNGFGGYVGAEGYYCEVVISAAGNINALSHSVADLLDPTPTP